MPIARSTERTLIGTALLVIPDAAELTLLLLISPLCSIDEITTCPIGLRSFAR